MSVTQIENEMTASLDPARLGEMEDAMAQMETNAAEAEKFLKTVSHKGRLMILCHLALGEKSVTELEMRLGVRQAAVSQHLIRLRNEGLVAGRRDGKTVYYSLAEEKSRRLIELLHELFC